MVTGMDDPMVLESVLAARAREIKEAVLETRVFENSVVHSPASGVAEVADRVFVRRTQPTGLCVQVGTPSEMMTEMDDPMVLESILAARAREKKEASLENGVFENSVGDSPAAGATEVADEVVGMETSPPAPTPSPLSDDTSKHGEGAQSEAAQEEGLSRPTKPSEGDRVMELDFGSSSFSSPNSGTLNDTTFEGTVVGQKKRRNRGGNWGPKETDDLLNAVSTTHKAGTRTKQGNWDATAKEVPGRTGHECQDRMDTLKKSFSKVKNYCDDHGKGFNQLNEQDFRQMNLSPRLTEAWYNQIRDNCPPRLQKKSKTNGAGSSSKSTSFVPDTSILGLQQLVLPDGTNQGEPTSVDRPAGQLECLQVVAPLHQAPPASPPRSDDLEGLPGASTVADGSEQQALSPEWNDLPDLFDLPSLHSNTF